VLVLAFLASAACRSEPAGDTYLQDILAARAEKDRMFREDAGSPVPRTQRDTLLPLKYFPPDRSFRVPAVLQPAPADAPVSEMPTSTGRTRKMRMAGTLQFTLRDTPLKLVAFEDEGGRSRLFVPFTDLTTGTETYAAGRYLEIERTPTSIYELDFNHAYQPYCYFDSRFDCPFPPPENRLKIPIRAGERLPSSPR
jgi:uncharacterized protein (DUF1684 family)